MIFNQIAFQRAGLGLFVPWFAIWCPLLGCPLVGCEKPVPQEVKVTPIVETESVFLSDGVRELQLNGSLSPDRSITLSFATVGTVKKVNVEEGEKVAKGRILAVLDDRSYRDSLGIAESKAEQAEDAYRRIQPMYQNKTIPEVKMVEIETGRQQAALTVSMAKKNLEDTVLRASVSGYVAQRNVEPGSTAAPGTPAITLVQTKNLKAVAPVPEMQVGKLKIGMKAVVTVPSLQKSFDGEITDIGIIANPLTRTYNLEVALPNEQGELRIGMIANVRIKMHDDESGLVVPPSAVRVNDKGENYVFVVTPNKTVQQRAVKIDRFIQDGIAIAEGVKEGELVVTSGTPMLADGMSVRLAETASTPKPISASESDTGIEKQEGAENTRREVPSGPDTPRKVAAHPSTPKEKSADSTTKTESADSTTETESNP